MDGIANLQTLRHTEQNKVNSVLRLLSICYQINGCCHENCRFSSSRAGFFRFSEYFTYSHSIVAGGLLVMSYTIRLMPLTSLTIRADTRSSTS